MALVANQLSLQPFEKALLDADTLTRPLVGKGTGRIKRIRVIGITYRPEFHHLTIRNLVRLAGITMPHHTYGHRTIRQDSCLAMPVVLFRQEQQVMYRGMQLAGLYALGINRLPIKPWNKRGITILF